MFHGRKKQAQQEAPSAEELVARKAKLEKIVLINKTMLAKRASKDLSKESFAQTEKFASLSPDFMTLWNYRREIFKHLWAEADTPARMEMVKAELMMLLKLVKRSPKSYTLWFHRQWTIEEGLAEEAKVVEGWKSKILEMELGLCSQMLVMDERNFHCWNYRLWVVETYLKVIQTRCSEEEVRPT